MSAYVTLATPMIDRSCLLAALADLGFGAERVEVHEQAVPLVGYEGQARGQHAHIVIRRREVGHASNDIGFEQTPTGFRTYVSDYDQAGQSGGYGAAWMRRLEERYWHHDALAQQREAERCERARQQLVEAQRQQVHDKARALGYRVQESWQGDKLRLVLVKRVY